MIVMLPYGRGERPLALPPPWEPTVIRKRAMPVLADPVAAVSAALREPLEAPPLAARARAGQTACILVCDVTRPVPNGLLLPPLLDELLSAGVAPGDITVLVATGLHRPNRGEELRRLVGSDRVLSTVTVRNHYAERDADHVDLGVSARGTPILLDRRFVEADLRIVTGLVEPHFMAGYSGGRKVVVPGIAHARTIARIHAADVLDHPRCAARQLAGNPLHEEQLDLVRRLGAIDAVSVVVDEKRRLCHVSFGALEPSHQAAVAFFEAHGVVRVGRRFRTVVTSAAGHPLDATYYQTVKALVAPLPVVAPGGRLFVVSACDQGLGSAAYRDAQARLVAHGSEAFLREIRGRTAARTDEWQTQMQLQATAATSVALHTDGLSAEERALTGLDHVAPLARLEADLERWRQSHGDPAVAVIPEGPYVMPLV